MNKLVLSALMLLVALFSSCSKKSTPAPTKHIIKVTATATGNYQASVSIKKSGEDTKTIVDSKTMSSGGSYDYTTSGLTAGDQVFVSHYNPDPLATIKVNFAIMDNGTQKLGEDDKWLSSLSIQYTVK